MGHPVGNPQQPLNTPSANTSGQILNSNPGQTAEPFYGTTTPPQDLNQPQPAVDPLAATLSTFNQFLKLKKGIYWWR